MALFNLKKNQKKDPFLDFYFSLEDSNRFPFKMALDNLKHLEHEVGSDEDLLFCTLEDSVFSSLQATYYEEMFQALKDNPDVFNELIHKFNDSKESRDQLILSQAQKHVNYIVRGGMCQGCDQCENHKDVDELIPYYQNGDISFFIKIYLGMQAIHLGMESLLFDFLPTHSDFVGELSRERVFEYRSAIFKHAEDEFEKLFHGN